MINDTNLGDCLDILKDIHEETVDLVYLDPPFFTQKTQKLSPRDRSREFQFLDTWSSRNEYADFLYPRLKELKRVLKSTGAIFFHCDRNASHIARILLNDIFGQKFFRSEIIWYYRRWSNSYKGLLSAHQNILYYSKTENYKFNEILTTYSTSTNVDQILQKRARDEFNKSVYAKDKEGNIIMNGYKKGVPLGDVWDIPFLNPKAKERTGYPTQKPILLLERIIRLVTDKGDLVLDPFCGSGTTLVAAQLLKRRYIGIDISPEAIEITNKRLANPIKSRSFLMEAGRDAYEKSDTTALAHLIGLDVVPVQRNKGIDALLKLEYKGVPVPIRVQRPNETLGEAASSLYKAAISKNASVMILVSTEDELDFGLDLSLPPEIIVISSVSKEIHKIIRQLKNGEGPSSKETSRS